MLTISSQRYLDPRVFTQKRAEGDYEVLFAVLRLFGKKYRVILDGHHSLAAAQLDGVRPKFVEARYDYQREVDSIGAEQWLVQHWNDSDWYDVETGRIVRF